jgi:hypothetical protein
VLDGGSATIFRSGFARTRPLREVTGVRLEAEWRRLMLAPLRGLNQEEVARDLGVPVARLYKISLDKLQQDVGKG